MNTERSCLMYCVRVSKYGENVCIKQLYDEDEYVEFVDGMLVILNALNVKYEYFEQFDDKKSITNLRIEIL